MMSFIMSCLNRRYTRMQTSDSDLEDAFDESSREETRDRLLWSEDIGLHCYGQYSYAVVQANEVIEDHSQLDIGRDGTFVGVFDGHGGHEASKFASENLFSKIISRARENNGTISEDTIRKAIADTETEFIGFVRRASGIKQSICGAGSCCLAGLIWQGKLYIANLGDSRAVLGFSDRSNKIVAQALTRDDNVSSEEVRNELKALHPNDPSILIERDGVWRVKGIIQVSRTIGDAYLKYPEFAFDRSFPRFFLPVPITRAVLSSEPVISTRVLDPNHDKFIIFASDGLWEHLSNQQAAEIVHKSSRHGIARKLVVAAQNMAAHRSRIGYKQLKRIDKTNRRRVHDDITVIVIYLDNGFEYRQPVEEVSVRGYIGSNLPSKFRLLNECRASSSSAK